MKKLTLLLCLCGLSVFGQAGRTPGIIAIAGLGVSSNDVYNIISTVPITFQTNVVISYNLTVSGKANFTSNVYITMLSSPTNVWAGPTNSLNLVTNEIFYVTTTDVAITNIGGQSHTNNTWATLIISNAAAGDIVVRNYAPGIRLQGSSSSAALTVASGKEAFTTVHSRGVLSTNVVNSVQQ